MSSPVVPVARVESRGDHRRIAEAIASSSVDGSIGSAMFAEFASLVDAASRPPDFTEHSVRFGASIEPLRITHYFDRRSDEIESVLATSARLLTLVRTLEFDAPDSLRRLLDASIPNPQRVEQTVLGIDARAERSLSRLKLYFVFSEPNGEAYEHVRDALGVGRIAGLDPAQVRLLGVDVSPDGRVELKAYLRLDSRRIRQTVRVLGAAAALVSSSREIVLAQGHGHSARRQLHLHATGEARFRSWLESRRRDAPGVGAMLAHVDAVNARLDTLRLAPWIIGLPYEDGRLDTTAGNVYFHPMPKAI